MPELVLPSNEIARGVYALTAELFAHTSGEDAWMVVDPGPYDYLFDDPDSYEGRCRLYDQLFCLSNSVISEPSDSGGGVRYQLSRLAVNAGAEPLKPKVTSNGATSPACLYAELHLGRTLRWLQRRDRQAHTDRQLPGVVYDTNGEPCGIQKSHGAATVFVWRTSNVATTSGERVVSMGSFVEFKYNRWCSDVRRNYEKGGKAVIDLSDAVPEEINMLRFSTLTLNRTLAKMVLWDTVQTQWLISGGEILTLAEQVSPVSRLSSAQVGSIVCNYV